MSSPSGHRAWRFTRSVALRFGRSLSRGRVNAVVSTATYVELGHWLRAHGMRSKPQFPDRYKLYATIASKFQDSRVLYLEFGVYQGASLRAWSDLLKNPQSQLHGFDSFEGLPEEWNARNPKGTFDLKGALPQFTDPRVALHPGWFDQTLPAFVLPEHERLVVHVDADRYSSTKQVLEHLQSAVRPGTVVVFDEFLDRQHEWRAFDEFLAAHEEMKFTFLGATANFVQCAFERIS